MVHVHVLDDFQRVAVRLPNETHTHPRPLTNVMARIFEHFQFQGCCLIRVFAYDWGVHVKLLCREHTSRLNRSGIFDGLQFDQIWSRSFQQESTFAFLPLPSLLSFSFFLWTGITMDAGCDNRYLSPMSVDRMAMEKHLNFR